MIAGLDRSAAGTEVWIVFALLTFGDCKGWAPLVTENIQADAAVGIDVRVVDAGGEVDLGRFEGIVGGKMDS